MKKQIPKTLGIVLSAAMLAMSFGCAKTNGASSSGSGVSSGASAVSSSVSGVSMTAASGSGSAASGISGKGTDAASGGNTATGSKFVDKVYNLNGRVITIVSTNSAPLSNTLLYKSMKQTEKRFNCTFKWVVSSDYNSSLTTLTKDYMAGKASFDVFQMQECDLFPTYEANGTLLPMDTVYNFAQDPKWKASSEVSSSGWWKEHKYGIFAEISQPGYAIFYNKALFRKFNVTDPWTYINNNNWNFNTFRDVCKKLTKDTNGDGTPDYWAFTSEEPWLDFVLANGGSVVTPNTSAGTAKVTLNSTASLNALQYVSDLFNVDKVIPTGAQLGKICSAPVDAMFTGKVAMFPYQVWYGPALMKKGIAASDIGWCYFPKGPNAKDYVIPAMTKEPEWVFPAKIANAQGVVAAVQDALAYWGSDKNPAVSFNAGYDEMLNNSQLTPVLTGDNKKLFEEGGAKTESDMTLNFGIYLSLQKNVEPLILNQQLTPKAAITTYLPQLQQNVDAKCLGN